MKLFIDSGNIKDIEALALIGIIDGVTTNPTLLAKEPGDYRQNLKKICDIVKGPVSAEVVSTKHDDMMKEAREYAALRPNIVVKIPLIPEGLKALRTCTEEGIKTNCTLCFSATQALLAAKAGATYISPFVGRSRPLIVRSRVVLPAPLAPMSVTISPRSIWSETPCSAWMTP